MTTVYALNLRACLVSMPYAFKANQAKVALSKIGQCHASRLQSCNAFNLTQFPRSLQNNLQPKGLYFTFLMSSSLKQSNTLTSQLEKTLRNSPQSHYHSNSLKHLILNSL